PAIPKQATTNIAIPAQSLSRSSRTTRKATSSQVITFVSSDGVERAHPRTVKNSSRSFSISAIG
ncbi:hypothetical protein, partial [Bradyrhizobium manausense]|uniref:hypothetical protein n=1 Tax=Bradyrhizobium manausense TaxID=989370 RepID=UPI00196AF355